MTEPDEPDPAGVLSSLPATRPQRRSPKRRAAPSADAAPADAAPAPAPAPAPKGRGKAAGGGDPDRPPAAPNPPARRRRAPTSPAGPSPATRKPRAPASPARADSPPPGARRGAAVRADRPPPIATQGYEADSARGRVEPPSRTDLIGSVAKGAGELAQVGIDLGRQVLRSVLRRLPGA